jgi:hypothetical protein
MVLGKGEKGYLVTLGWPDRTFLIVEMWADTIEDAIAHVGTLTDGEVVTVLKLWVP